MPNKISRQGKSKRNRRILVVAIAIFLVLISALTYISIVNQTEPPLQDSSKYFAISNLAGTYQTLGSKYDASDPGPAVLITDFAFNFTPVGGDTHNVRIFVEGMANPTLTWWPDLIRNGTSTFSQEIQPPNQILLHQQDDGTYPLSIRMLADEANGTITLNFNATMPGGNFVYMGPYTP